MRPEAPSLQTHWDWRAAGNFIGGGSGTGLLVFAALGPESLLQPLAALALVLIGAGLACVWAELGRPLRALNVFRHPRTSWMTREAALSVPLMLLGALGVLGASRPLVLAAALTGLGFLYCQGRILRAARGIPAWRSSRVVALIIGNGLVEGAGLWLIALALTAGEPHTPDLLIGLVLIGLRLVACWRPYLDAVCAPGKAPLATVRAWARVMPLIDWVGHGLPLALLGAALVAPGLAAPLAGLAGLAAVASGWLTKYWLITRAAYNQGFAVAHTPARTPGYSGPGVKPGWS